MPRTTQAGTAYPRQYRGETVRLAQVTTNLKTHYFADAETDFNGQHYIGWLIVDEPIHRYDSLQRDDASLKLSNVTGDLEAMVFAEVWEGALVVLLDYFTALGKGLTATVELIRGKLGARVQADEQIMAWNLLPLYDPQKISAPSEIFAENCGFRFKDNRCGYVNGVDPNDPATGLPFVLCDKNLAHCQARGRAHRYPGFVQVTFDLIKLYPPKAHPASGSGGRVSNFSGLGEARRFAPR